MNEKEKEKKMIEFEKKVNQGVYKGVTWEMLSKENQYLLALVQTNFDEQEALFMVNIGTLPRTDGNQIIVY